LGFGLRQSNPTIFSENLRPGFSSVSAFDSVVRRLRFFADSRDDFARLYPDRDCSNFDNCSRTVFRARHVLVNFTEKDAALILTIRVVPRASKSEIVGEHDGALKIRIAAARVEGAANAELIKVLAKFFAVSKSAVEILSGETSKTKQIKIIGANAAKLREI
jgi:hypothetical protein